MGADKLDENTPNAPKFFHPICLPNPNSLIFSKKKLWVSVVRDDCHSKLHFDEIFIFIFFQILVFCAQTLLTPWQSRIEWEERLSTTQLFVMTEDNITISLKNMVLIPV